jgi:phage shock protein PspC (stress-responsive transcriptional regulator)
MSKKFMRSNDGVFLGVCSGLGDYFDIDPFIVRIVFFSLYFTSIPIIALYIIIAIISDTNE